MTQHSTQRGSPQTALQARSLGVSSLPLRFCLFGYIESVCIFGLICVIGWISSANGNAQEPPSDSDLRFEASVGGGGLSLESAGVAAQSTLVSDALIVIRCNVRNGGDQPAVGYLSGRTVGNLGEDDRRRIEIPPKQIRSYELQVRPPVPLPDTRVDIEVSLYSVVDGKESVVVQGEEPATRIVTLWRPSKNPLLAAVALGRESPEPLEWRWSKTKPFGPYEFAMASRVDAELTKDWIGCGAISTQSDRLEEHRFADAC